MFNSEWLPIAYGLSSAVSWGAADFSGGIATRRTPVYSVIFISQIIGAGLLVALAFIFGEKFPGLRHMIWGGCAGLAGSFGLMALYKGLAVGRMGVVAPLSAIVSALVPIVFAVFIEGLPRYPQMAGFGVAVLAVWFISYQSGGASIRGSELYLPLVAGLGFGLFFICIDRVSHEAILWPLVAARIVSIGIMAAIMLNRGDLGLPKINRLPAIVFAGLFDTGGNAFFALASGLGRLDVSVVLGSLYPAATVMLAWFILKERLVPRQWAGIAAALVALILIAF